MNRVLLLDIGSVQTKALLLAKQHSKWSILDKNKGVTTVEEPESDAGIGVKRILNSLLEKCKCRMAEIDKVYIGSSAGGGLQMVAAGVVKTMTAESAWRAALGSGAIVTNVIHGGSVHKQSERFMQFKKTKPDIILLAGGTEGGNEDQVVGLAETINVAQVKSRFGNSFAPVVFAGNSEVRDAVGEYLNDEVKLHIAENIRPELETERVEMVNDVIQQIYMQQVVRNVPGLEKVAKQYNSSIQPIASGMRKLINQWSISNNCNAILFDIGGFTTDSYSSIEYVRRAYKRPRNNDLTIGVHIGNVRERKEFTSISASAGLNYSAARLLKKVGVENIVKWMPEQESSLVYNACFNRMIEPLVDYTSERQVTLPLIAGALKVSFAEHQEIAGKLHGVGIVRNMSEALDQDAFNSGTLAEWHSLDDIILTGGVFAELKNAEIIHVVNDTLQPTGITNLFYDRHNVISQLSVFDIEGDISIVELVRSALIPMATIIAPMKSGKRMPYRLAQLKITYQNGNTEVIDMFHNKLHFPELKQEPIQNIEITPHRKVNFGAGNGVVINKQFSGQLDLIIDGRRPLKEDFRYRDIKKWYGENYSKLQRGGLDA